MTGFPFGLLSVALTGLLVLIVFAALRYDWEDEPEETPEELSRRVSALETVVNPETPERDQLVMFVDRAVRGEYGEDPSVDAAARFVRDLLGIQDGDLDDMEDDDDGTDA